MQFYYSQKCGHSLSMMEMLTQYNSFVNPSELEMIDVHDRKTIIPSEIKGTPAIVHDGQVYHGDYAFELLGGPARGGVEHASEATAEGSGANDLGAGVQGAATEQHCGVRRQCGGGLFDCDPMLPRS